jgi:hypothetical protein
VCLIHRSSFGESLFVILGRFIASTLWCESTSNKQDYSDYSLTRRSETFHISM